MNSDPVSRSLREEYYRRLLAKTRRTTTNAGYADWLLQTYPHGWYLPRHIRRVARDIDDVLQGRCDRYAVRMPPRHGKTENVTVRLAVRMLELDPAANVLISGYNERFARRLGRKARNLAQGRIAIAQDSTAADEWHTTAGGVMMTRGMGSPPTGTGFRLIVIDDPIRSREDAESEVKREAAWDHYTDDLLTRLDPGGAIVIVMTPWHEDGLDARAIASEPDRWRVLSLPALARDNDPLGRAPGEALWPERYDRDALLRIKSIMDQNDGERSFEALYQQNPQPREGSIFKPDRVRIVDDPPAAPVSICRAWDFAATAGGGDYTVGVLMCRAADGSFGVLDVVRGRWAPDERDAQMRRAAEVDGRAALIRIPQDPGQAGKDQVLHMARMLSGCNMRSAPVTGAKEVRASGFASQVNAGNVWAIRGAWNHAYLSELRSFREGCLHDDQVDASADAFAELAGARRMRVLGDD
jgi:predicted phage terminase large subunit-like protein